MARTAAMKTDRTNLADVSCELYVTVICPLTDNLAQNQLPPASISRGPPSIDTRGMVAAFCVPARRSRKGSCMQTRTYTNTDIR